MITPKLLVDRRVETEAAWLEARFSGMTGSDAAAALGVDPRKSRTALYYEKIRRVLDSEETEAMRWGTLLEPLIRDEFARRTGFEVSDPQILVAHPEETWMLASPDGFVTRPDASRGLLEVKSTSAFLASDWGDGPPDRAVAQTAHYMKVYEADWAYVAVLIGGQRYQHYFVERDDKILSRVTEIEASMWFDHVQAQVPPPLDGAGTKSTTDALKGMYPFATEGKITELPSDLHDVARELMAVRSAKSAAEKREDVLADQLRAAIGDAEIVTVDGVDVATLKTSSPRRFHAKAFAADHPALYEEYVTQESQRALRFTKAARELWA